MSTPYTIREDRATKIVLVGDFGGFTIVATGVDPEVTPIETEKMDVWGAVLAAASMLGPTFYYHPDLEHQILDRFLTELHERGYLAHKRAALKI